MDNRIKAAIVGGVFILIAAFIPVLGPTIIDRFSVTDHYVQNIASQTEESVEQNEAPAEMLISNPPLLAEDSCTSNPPPGLVHFWQEGSLLWSCGVWGSDNLINFTTGLAEIDTDHFAFGEFRIWLDPCKIDTNGADHGYVDGARFGPLEPKGAGHSSPPLIIGQEAVIRISPNTGKWGLGNP